MKDKEKFLDSYCEILNIVQQHHMANQFKECTQVLSYPKVGTDKKTGDVRKIDMGGVSVIQRWIGEGMKKGDDLLETLLNNYEGDAYDTVWF